MMRITGPLDSENLRRLRKAGVDGSYLAVLLHIEAWKARAVTPKRTTATGGVFAVKRTSTTDPGGGRKHAEGLLRNAEAVLAASAILPTATKKATVDDTGELVKAIAQGARFHHGGKVLS